MIKDSDSQKKQYDTIMGLYDMVEELAGTTENKLVKNQEAHFAAIEPLINNIADSADILSEEYIAILENPSLSKTAKMKIEKTLRKIFMALENYRKRLTEQGGDILTALANLVNPIIDKIHKQAEKIIIIFMQLLKLSLDSIMHKQELDEFRRNNETLFRAMPQLMP